MADSMEMSFCSSFTREFPVILPILKEKKLKFRNMTNFSSHTLIFGELYELLITITCI